MWPFKKKVKPKAERPPCPTSPDYTGHTPVTVLTYTGQEYKCWFTGCNCWIYHDEYGYGYWHNGGQSSTDLAQNAINLWLSRGWTAMPILKPVPGTPDCFSTITVNIRISDVRKMEIGWVHSQPPALTYPPEMYPKEAAQ